MVKCFCPMKVKVFCRGVSFDFVFVHKINIYLPPDKATDFEINPMVLLVLTGVAVGIFLSLSC